MKSMRSCDALIGHLIGSGNDLARDRHQAITWMAEPMLTSSQLDPWEQISVKF